MTITHGETMEVGMPPKPFVGIYIREQPMASATDMAKARDELLQFAEDKGFDKDGVEIFVEKLEAEEPEAFGRLVEKTSFAGDATVIIPSIYHLSNLGDSPLAILRALTANGVDVLIRGS